jgi:hypothetical protein
VLLLPLAAPVLRRGQPAVDALARYAVLGLLGIGMYNALQYLALQTSTPINVTLVTSSMPVWMLATGWLFFGAGISAREIGSAVLSMLGRAAGAEPRRMEPAAGPAAGARRHVHAAGHHRLGLLQLAARCARTSRRRCARTGLRF